MKYLALFISLIGSITLSAEPFCTELDKKPHSYSIAYKDVVIANGGYHSSDSLYALNRKSGEIIWTVDLNNKLQGHSIVDSTLYVTAGWLSRVKDGEIFAIDLGTGKVLWKYKEPNNFFHNAVVANGTVYIGTKNYLGGDGTVMAIDGAKGSKNWVKKFGGNVLGSPKVVSKGILMNVVEKGGAYSNHKILVLDETSGEVISSKEYVWRHQSPPVKKFENVFPTDNGGILYGAYQNNPYFPPSDPRRFEGPRSWKIHGFDGELSSESHFWKETLDGDLKGYISENGITYLATTRVPWDSGFQPGLVAISERTGRKLWVFKGKVGTGFNSSPIISGDRIYVSSTNWVTSDECCAQITTYSIEKQTGNINWKRTIKGNLGSATALDNKDVYVAGRNSKLGSLYGTLHAVDKESGDVNWETKFGSIPVSTPLVYRGLVYLGLDSYQVCAFDAETGENVVSKNKPGF